MMRRNVTILAAFIFVAAPGRGAISARVDPKAGAIRKVCILPVEATLTRVGMKGGASLTNVSEEWAGKIGSTVRHAVEKSGGTVTETVASDENAQQAMVRLRQKYESIAGQMLKKPGQVKKARYTLGDEVALLPCAADADAIAFVDATAWVQTGGRKTFDILVGGVAGLMTAQNRYDIRIALVNAKTGEVTALLRETTVGGKTGKDPEAALTKALAEEFKKLSRS